MDFSFGPEDIRHLAKMLHGTKNETSDSDDDTGEQAHTSKNLGPADIVHKSTPDLAPAEPVESASNEKAQIVMTSYVNDDDRLKPEFRFTYSQEVKSEDVFLGLGLRTPASASCENLRVTLQMPEEEAASSEIDAQVDCARNCLELSSPRYRLSLPLPQPADQRTSLHRAQWDHMKRQLVVTIRLNRELDYTNF